MRQPLTQLLQRLWPYINRRRRLQFTAILFLMVLASFAEILSIGAVVPFLGVLTAPERVFAHPLAQPLIHGFGLTGPQQLLVILTGIFVLAAIFSGATRLTLLWAQIRFSHAVGADLSMSIYYRTLHQPYAVHISRNSSEIIAGISQKADGVAHWIVMPLLTLLSASLLLFAILAVLVQIDAFVALFAFAGFGSIYGAVIFLTKKRLTRDSQRISVEQGQVIKALQEGLGGIRDVLIDGTQLSCCEIYRNADMPLRRAQANIQIIGSSPRFGIEALGMALIAALALSMTSRPEGVGAVIPVLGALALGAQRLLPVLQQAYSNWSSMRGGEVLLRDALELLEQPLPEHVDAPVPTLLVFRKSIALRSVSFRYGPASPWVLRDLSLEIPKGSRIGFIGTTGSGKSTLLDIVMGLLPASKGELTVDGQAVTPRNCRAWQMHIAHVPQAIFLTDASIEENIAFGVKKSEIDFARVKEAAGKAQIADTIESWPLQYKTNVGERGVRLSGGQRQRIGIARALYKQADVIVFDEATSALDSDTEREVMQAIENLGEALTILMVAHRLSTLKNCSQIVELSDGEVKRVCTYSDMLGAPS